MPDAQPTTQSTVKPSNSGHTPATLEEIVALAKRRGFVYPTSQIYGGLANSYDYGPLGTELLRNLKNSWWRYFIHARPDMVGLDTQILQHPKTWVASGHVASFSDPLVENKATHQRFRADHLIEEVQDAIKKICALEPTQLQSVIDQTKDRLEKEVAKLMLKKAQNKLSSSDEEIWKVLTEVNQSEPVTDFAFDDLKELFQKINVVLLKLTGSDFTEPKKFNLLFESAIGSVADEKAIIYLRGETAQGIFTNFKQVLDSTRVQLPFGIGNIGKSFRNEITTGQFVFRTLEFEQAEIEYFFDPDESDWTQLLSDWKEAMWQFVTQELGISPDRLRWRRHTDQERSHYSKDTYDLDYHFPFGWKELWGVAYRTDYDLRQHQEHSGQKLEYTNPVTGRSFIPHVIEPAVGVNRLFLMMLCEAYWVDQAHQRTVLQLPTRLAPYQVAVFPLLKNKPELVAKAREVLALVSPHFYAAWDDRGNIGKRYLYQDEVGTPLCVTVDFQTLEDQAVTVRHRDSTSQDRVPLDKLVSVLQNMIG